MNGARVKRHGRFEAVRFSVRLLAEFESGKGILLIGFEDEKERRDGAAEIVLENLSQLGVCAGCNGKNRRHLTGDKRFFRLAKRIKSLCHAGASN